MGQKSIKRKKLWQIDYPVRFIAIASALITVCLLMGLWPMIIMLNNTADKTLSVTPLNVIPYICLGLACVICIVTLMLVLYLSLAPLPRIEAILEQIVKGNYSLRITLRKGDFLLPLAEKLNKLFALLEEKSKR